MEAKTLGAALAGSAGAPPRPPRHARRARRRPARRRRRLRPKPSYLRGIRWAPGADEPNVAQVDAAIGGKDRDRPPQGKNSSARFHGTARRSATRLSRDAAVLAAPPLMAWRGREDRPARETSRFGVHRRRARRRCARPQSAVACATRNDARTARCEPRPHVRHALEARRRIRRGQPRPDGFALGLIEAFALYGRDTRRWRSASRRSVPASTGKGRGRRASATRRTFGGSSLPQARLHRRPTARASSRPFPPGTASRRTRRAGSPDSIAADCAVLVLKRPSTAVSAAATRRSTGGISIAAARVRSYDWGPSSKMDGAVRQTHHEGEFIKWNPRRLRQQRRGRHQPGRLEHYDWSTTTPSRALAPERRSPL